MALSANDRCRSKARKPWPVPNGTTLRVFGQKITKSQSASRAGCKRGLPSHRADWYETSLKVAPFRSIPYCSPDLGSTPCNIRSGAIRIDPLMASAYISRKRLYGIGAHLDASGQEPHTLLSDCSPLFLRPGCQEAFHAVIPSCGVSTARCYCR